MPAPAVPPPEFNDTQFQRLLIDELIEMGAAVMRGIHQKANAKRAADRNLSDLVKGFEQVSRAIRRSIILAMRSPAPPETDDAHRLAIRTRLIRQVEAAITGAGSSDPDEDIPDLPTPMILAEICRDLGRASTHLGTRTWQRQVPADVLALCARAARAA